MELYKCSVSTLAHKLHEREISSHELTEYFLARIEEHDKKLGAYITVCREEALKQADYADKLIADGDSTGITGIPISVKDNICTENLKTTCASKMLENFRPTYDAYAVSNLRNKGAVILGKTNMDEFAMGALGKNSALLQTYNPLNNEYAVGGSSCGAAAALAGGMCSFSVGSDTGGSVRIPASFCGLVGYKPSYGAISRYGLVSYASSFDQIGLIVRKIDDLMTVFPAVCGRDLRDMTSCAVNICDNPPLPKKIKFAVIGEIGGELIGKLSDVGKVERIVFPDYNKLCDIYDRIACCEAYSNLSRYDGIKYGFSDGKTVSDVREGGFGTEVLKRIKRGKDYLEKGKYETSLSDARAAVQYTESLFDNADILVTPLHDGTVPKRDSSDSGNLDTHTVLANIAGLPAISIPTGADMNGMPSSIQLMSRRFSDSALIKTASLLFCGR